MAVLDDEQLVCGTLLLSATNEWPGYSPDAGTRAKIAYDEVSAKLTADPKLSASLNLIRGVAMDIQNRALGTADYGTPEDCMRAAARSLINAGS